MKRITKLLALLLIMMVLFGCTAKQAQSVDSVEKEDLSANVIPSTNTAVIPELYVANKDETLEYEPVVFIKDGVTSNSTSGRPDAFESRVFGFGVRSKPEKYEDFVTGYNVSVDNEEYEEYLTWRNKGDAFPFEALFFRYKGLNVYIYVGTVEDYVNKYAYGFLVLGREKTMEQVPYAVKDLIEVDNEGIATENNKHDYKDHWEVFRLEEVGTIIDGKAMYSFDYCTCRYDSEETENKPTQMINNHRLVFFGNGQYIMMIDVENIRYASVGQEEGTYEEKMAKSREAMDELFSRFYWLK